MGVYSRISGAGRPSNFAIMHRNFKKALNIIPNVLRNNSTKVGHVRAASSYAEVVSNLPATQVTRLDNGLKVATEETDSEVATVGVWLNVGSRYETNWGDEKEWGNNGVGNFLQHMAFQGTKKRSQAQLEKELDSMGAELHAFNTREITAYYANCLKGDVPKVVEILADITQNCSPGQDEIEQTRATILENLENMQSDYEAICYDYLHATAFQGTSLAHSVYGSTRDIKSITRDHLEFFHANHYTPANMVLAAAGGVSGEQVAELANTHFKGSGNFSAASFPKYARYTGSEIRARDDDLPFCYIAAGVRTCGWAEPEVVPLMLATELIGEWDKGTGSVGVTGNSLAMKAVQYDCFEAFKAFNIHYRDTGLFGVYFVGEATILDTSMSIIQHEWMQLCETITDADVDRARNNLLRKLLVANQSTVATCHDIGRTLLYNQKRPSFEMLDRELRNTTASKLRAVCSKFLYDKCLVQAGVGRVEAMSDYGIARNRMYWIRL